MVKDYFTKSVIWLTGRLYEGCGGWRWLWGVGLGGSSPIWPSVSRPQNEVLAKYLNDSLTEEEAVKQMHRILAEESRKRGFI